MTGNGSHRAGPDPDAVFGRYFDQLQVGDVFATDARPIGDEEVMKFAALSGDWHPQHTDGEWASRSPFGRRIVHGMLVLSCGLGSIRVDPDKALALRRVRDAVFKRPLYIGEEIALRGRVEEMRPIDDQNGLVSCSCRVLNAEGRSVVVARVDVLWRREPGAEMADRDEQRSAVMG